MPLTAKALKAPVAIAPPIANDAWGEPQPFDATDVPGFDATTLPRWLGDWTRAVSDFCQVPMDLPGVVGLATTALAASRRFHVQVRPGWEEPTNLYAVAALAPGERKSPVFSKAIAPLYAYHTEVCSELAPRVAQREAERRILAGQVVAAESAAVKGKQYEGQDARRAAIELAAQLSDLPELHTPALIADDCTPEALAVLLSQGDERIGVFSAEGGPFEIMSGRYSERGSNFEIFLKAHPGDRHTVHRIKREPITLVHPLVTMALTVQPAVIQGLAKKEGFRGLGLLARFLYALPKSRMGCRSVESPPIPPHVERDYHEAVDRVLRLTGDDRLLVMSADADRARCAFQAQLEPRLGPDGDLEPIADWAGKLVGTVCRLAGVLHVAGHALEAEIPSAVTVDTFERATRLGLYFLEHARVAFGAMGADDETELAKRLWEWIRRKDVQIFRMRDAQRALTRESAQTLNAVAALVERNLIRKMPAASAGGGRPPGDSYEVNPLTRLVP